MRPAIPDRVSERVGEATAADSLQRNTGGVDVEDDHHGDRVGG